MDYLSIQVLAVPAECAFSSCAEMDTMWWNHINPLLMEALQMWKFALCCNSLNFTSRFLESNKNIPGLSSSDLLEKLASLFDTDENRENAMDKVLHVIQV